MIKGFFEVDDFNDVLARIVVRGDLPSDAVPAAGNQETSSYQGEQDGQVDGEKQGDEDVEGHWGLCYLRGGLTG